MSRRTSLRPKLAVLVCLYSLAPSAESKAGVLVPPAPHHVDAKEKKLDNKPPHAIDGIAVKVDRGQPPQCWGTEEKGQSCAQSSADGFGAIMLKFTPPADNRTNAAEMGYRLMIVEGAVPKNMIWPDYDILAIDGEIRVEWSDGTTRREIEPIRFVLSVRAIDKAGNVGPSERIEVAHPGRRERKRNRKARPSP